VVFGTDHDPDTTGHIVEPDRQPDGETGRVRASLIDRPLDVDERERLFALRAASSEQAAVYAAVLTVLAEAKAAYHLQMRTGEIRRRLEASPIAGGFDEFSDRALRPALDQLREWKCVDWVQDPSFRAASVEEYLKRHELWELTPIGEATLRSIRLVLTATEAPGSLQRAMFRQIRDALDDLADAIAVGDATRVYLRLRDLDLAIGELAANAREFYATINRIAREDRLEDHVFLLYKDQLIAYLQDFHDDLVRNRSLISRRLLDLDDQQRAELIRLADEGDDSTGLFGTGTSWASRWDGMLDWFVAGRVVRSEADSLIGATTVAIRELLTLLRRLTEQATRPVNRASELHATAAWFARCPTDDDAHELFDAAFGLSPTVHLGFAVADPDLAGRFPSWWRTDPVDIPVSLREYGRRAAPGRTARRHDFSDAKAALAAERARAEAQRSVASQRLVTIDIDDTVIDADAWPVMLSYLDQALAARPPASTFDTTIRTPHAVVRIRSAEHDTRLRAAAGTVSLHRCEVSVSAP
jgi:uncharacterized protein (TIGR02677 family)